jgi:hypothetical protein
VRFKWLAISFFGLWFLFSFVTARAEDDKAFHLRIEPHWLLNTEVALELQYRLGKHFSLGPTGAYMFESNSIHSSGHVSDRLLYKDKTKRYSLGLRGVFYFSGVDEHSVYLAVFGKVSPNKITSTSDSSFTATEPERTGKFTETTWGATVGFQWVLPVVTFNVGGGLAVYHHPESVRLSAAGGGNVYDYRLVDDKVGFHLDAGMGFRF